MATEMSVFDPDAIQTTLDRDLAGGLRMLAEAIEQGAMLGRLVSAEGVAGGRRDAEAAVLVRIVVSAPVRTVRRVQDVAQLGGRRGCSDGLETVS